MRRKWRYYTNGVNEISVFEGETPPEGYFPGRKPVSAETKQKQSESAQKRGPNNKGKKLSEQARKHMSESKKIFFKENPGWISTTWFEKGHVPWNKGVPCSDSTKAKLSISHTGRKYSDEVNKSKGRPGRHLDDETKRKISVSRKKYFFLNSDARALISARMSGRKLSDETKLKISKNRKIGSGPKSRSEESVFYILSSMFHYNVIRQYKEERYPFFCDFYIKHLDLFIECNFHWTHGPCPYDAKSSKCTELLSTWEEKSKNSDYFKDAIKIWTVRDAHKISTAQNNSLNYIVLYNRDDLKQLIKFFNRVEDINDFKRRIQKNDIFWYRNVA